MKAKPSSHPGEITLELNRRDEPLMEAATNAAVKSPFSIKRILVPVDFSECSKKALQYALPLAKEHKASLVVLHVVNPARLAESGDVFTGNLAVDKLGDIERDLTKLIADEVKEEVDAVGLARVGSPAITITVAARVLNADLIVISTHGQTGLRHLFLGSVAEAVVQQAPCPVLVVREKEREILAPTVPGQA